MSRNTGEELDLSKLIDLTSRKPVLCCSIVPLVLVHTDPTGHRQVEQRE